MANFWLSILKPKGVYARWFTFLLLVALLVIGANGYFENVRQFLDTDSLTFEAGDFKISLYGILKAAIVIVVVFWIAAIASGIADNRVGKMKNLRASNKALILKLLNIAIYFIAFLLTLDIIGIDLTALTVFSGALGIGIGFGLQKISSNFISGIILLLEKSVEQDDLVELADGTFGFIKKAHSRYTLLETFDGKEILVPNEDFITSRVINWTFSSSKGRVEISLGVSYGSDIEKAYNLILEAAKEHPRCLTEPVPKCFLRNFGDSSVDFILHFWLDDITSGRWEPQSDVMFSIWRKFKENNIEIPFPQRDLHLKTPKELKISTVSE